MIVRSNSEGGVHSLYLTCDSEIATENLSFFSTYGPFRRKFWKRPQVVRSVTDVAARETNTHTSVLFFPIN